MKIICELTRKFSWIMGRLRPDYPGKFVGVELLVRAAQRSEPIVRPDLGGVAHIVGGREASGNNNEVTCQCEAQRNAGQVDLVVRFGIKLFKIH